MRPSWGRPFSKVSRDTLKALPGPGPVTITCAKVDRYGCSVCGASLGALDVMNLEMVRRGLAWQFKRPVHHQRLVRLAVAGHAEHFVLAALVVAVPAEGRVGQQ